RDRAPLPLAGAKRGKTCSGRTLIILSRNRSSGGPGPRSRDMYVLHPTDAGEVSGNGCSATSGIQAPLHSREPFGAPRPDQYLLAEAETRGRCVHVECHPLL